MKPVLAAMLSVSGLVLSDEEKRLLERANPLGVTLFARNIQTRAQVRRLTDEIRHAVGRKDVLIATDQEGGRVCRLKPPEFESYAAAAAIGALAPEERRRTARLHADLIARDLRDVGINMNYAPCLDVAYPETHAVLKSRCFSSDPRVVAELGQEMVRTYLAAGIIPCVKHLPGHGRAMTDPHLHLPVILGGRDALYPDLIPFRAVADIAPVAMTAHIRLPDIDEAPITESSCGIQEVIRKAVGFKGLLISDAIEMQALSGSLVERACRALDAGCDAITYCGGELCALQELVSAVRPLSKAALARFSAFVPLLSRTPAPLPPNARAVYQALLDKTTPPVDDYDAVETLNKMREGG